MTLLIVFQCKNNFRNIKYETDIFVKPKHIYLVCEDVRWKTKIQQKNLVNLGNSAIMQGLLILILHMLYL